MESHITDGCLASKYPEVNNLPILNHKNTTEAMNESTTKRIRYSGKRYAAVTDATEKVDKVKQCNFRRCKRQCSKCSSISRMHNTQQKLDPIMKFTL